MTLYVHGAQARLVHRKRSPDALTRAAPPRTVTPVRSGGGRRDIPVLSVRANLPAPSPVGERRRGRGHGGLNGSASRRRGGRAWRCRAWPVVNGSYVPGTLGDIRITAPGPPAWL